MTKSILSIHRYAAILMVSGLGAGLFGAGCAAETETVAEEEPTATTEPIGSTEQAVGGNVNPQCNVVDTVPQERHNHLWPRHEPGPCPELPEFTEDDARAACEGVYLRYFGFDCSEFRYGNNRYEYTWTAYFRCCR